MTEFLDLRPEVRGFISYRRDDNADFFGVVDKVRTMLSALVEAKTSMRLSLFIDHEGIGWGEDWRAAIDGAVRNATLFIPVITMRYFDSEICRDELAAYYAAARDAGVAELVLPIVLFGAGEIRDDHPRLEVQVLSRLNYEPIEEAWKAGYRSSQWRQAMVRCAERQPRQSD